MARGNASPALKQARANVSNLEARLAITTADLGKARTELQELDSHNEAKRATIEELRGQVVSLQAMIDRFLPPLPPPVGPFKDVYGCDVQGPITDNSGHTIE